MATTTQQQQQQRAQAAAAAAAAAASQAPAAGVAAAGVQPVEAVAKATAVAAVLAALVAFLARKRQADEQYLRRALGARAPRVGPDVIGQLVVEEAQRDEAFAMKASERVAREAARIVSIADVAERERQMQVMLDAEQRYAQQRTEAMAARAFAAVDRTVLRMDSPQGAFWKLDPTVRQHTPGCLVMGGRFWPWAVLDRVHPPRHAGCPCRLVGYGQAVADGLMQPSQVLDVSTAIRQAAGVLMEAEPDAPELAALQELLVEYEGRAEEGPPDEEAALRAALLQAGLTTPEQLEGLSGGA